jgi:hypothetical protein
MMQRPQRGCWQSRQISTLRNTVSQCPSGWPGHHWGRSDVFWVICYLDVVTSLSRFDFKSDESFRLQVLDPDVKDSLFVCFDH